MSCIAVNSGMWRSWWCFLKEKVVLPSKGVGCRWAHLCCPRPPSLLPAGLCHCWRSRSALAAAQPQLRLRATHTSALACLSPSPLVPQVMFNGARITKGVKRQIGFVLQVGALCVGCCAA